MADDKFSGIKDQGFAVRSTMLRGNGPLLPAALRNLMGGASNLTGQGYVSNPGGQSQASTQTLLQQPTRIDSPLMQSGGGYSVGNLTGGMREGGDNEGEGMRMAFPSMMGNPNAPLLSFRSQGYADGGMVPMMPGVQPGMPMGQMAGPQPGPPVSSAELESEVQRVANSNPEVMQQLQQIIMLALQSGKLTMDQLNMAIQLAKAAVQNPQLYPRLRALAIQRGLAAPDDLPEQYDQGIVFAFLLAGEAVQRTAGGQQVAPQPQGQMLADGGAVLPGDYAAGGGVAMGSPSGDRTGRADDIPIRVSGGEYVIPAHVVQAKGTEFFDRMLAQYNGADGKEGK